MEELEKILLKQQQENSGFSFMDAVKCIYQNEFGSEHMVMNSQYAYDLLKQEVKEKCVDQLTIEDIGNGFVRLHICQCNDKLINIIHYYFVKDSKLRKGTEESFISKLNDLKTIQQDHPEFLKDIDLQKEINNYLKEGIRAVHHSAAYTAAKPTHYRIMSKNSALIILACQKALTILDQKGSCTIAIDGKCTSGKTTLADELAKLLDADLIHVDDFFLQPYQRTPERYAMPGGNFDYERLTKEIIEPIKAGNLTQYQRFDCSKMQLGEMISLKNKQIRIIEGSYSLHPILNHYYDVSIALSISDELQDQRILKRNGIEMHKKFVDLWIPKENIYFETYSIFSQADYFLE